MSRQLPFPDLDYWPERLAVLLIVTYAAAILFYLGLVGLVLQSFSLSLRRVLLTFFVFSGREELRPAALRNARLRPAYWHFAYDASMRPPAARHPGKCARAVSYANTGFLFGGQRGVGIQVEMERGPRIDFIDVLASPGPLLVPKVNHNSDIVDFEPWRL